MNFFWRRKARLHRWLGVALLCCASNAFAADPWPSRPIRWIVPYSPGGGTDQASRVLAERLSFALGQPIVVENRPGGNTVIGAQAVAASAPDGYTVFFATLQTMSLIGHLMPKLPYAPDALVPVMQLVRYPLFLMVASDGPLDTMPRFLAASKSEPLFYAVGGIGSAGHLGTELLARQLHADMKPVPFKAMVQAAPEVAAGRVPFMFADLPAALPLVKGGRTKILATAGKTRSPLYPDAPTLAEAGAGPIAFDTWAGLAVPKGTPQAVVDRLVAELDRILADPAVRSRLATIGVEPAPSSQVAFIRFIDAESARWGALIEAAHITIE